MKKYSFGWVIATCVLGFYSVYCTVSTNTHPSPRQGINVVEFTDKEKQMPLLYQPFPAMSMIIRTVDPKEFSKKYGDDIAGVSYFGTGNTCIIEIPSDFTIVASPIRGFANFVKKEIPIDIAHEMLHCIRGNWHPKWKDNKMADPTNQRGEVRP
jgi:hypothetical protein